MSGVVRRFYRVRWRAAALLCLPGVLLVSWYAFSAFARFDAYRRAEKSDHPFDLELFQLELHDVLSRDLRRMTLPPSPETETIPRFAFQIRRPDLIALENSRDREERDYVPAQILLNDDKQQAVEVRLLGQKPWHVLYKQRSLKVQLPKGDLLDGHRVFTLTNDPSPMVVGEQIILDYLDRRGVLVPRSDFARVAINDTNLGVFRYETQPEESLLRVHRREPGSMYSGDLPGSARTEELWSSVTRWRKVAWRDEQDKDDYRELERLLAHVRGSTIAEFAEFARHEIDLEAFAKFDALDVAFGCDQHNYRENHKLYFDPYRGRWEPIAWGFRGFEHDPQFNRVENPMLLRLKFVPGWLALRDRLLYEFLMGDGSGAGVHARGLALWRRIGPELAADPWWDAYRLLPRVDEFLRELVRPMTLKRALLVFESELTTYERRRAFLIEELRKNPLWLHVRADEAAPGSTQLDVIVDGQAGVALESVRAEFPADCAAPGFTLARGGQELASATGAAAVELASAVPLYPAQRIAKLSEPTSGRGTVHVLMAPELYTFTLRSSCTPSRIEAVGSNLATGSRVHSQAATPELLQRLPGERLRPDSVPAFAAGEVWAHPFALPQPAPEQVQLGPGVVDIAQTRVFEAHQQVRVAPGTRLSMAEGASLVFLGRVLFEGTRSAPIAIERSGARPWGGIVVQGPATAGSRFSHVTASFGSTPAWRFQHYPGMIDLHDTADIALQGCQFTDNSGGDDLVHVAYVRGLSIEDSRFGRSHRDALDLEFTDAALRRLEIGEAGDDALDLMGSNVELVESVILGIKGNGISAGEESEVSLQDTLITDAGVGVLAKNASQVAIDGSLLYGAKTGVRVYTRTVRYAGDSSVQADVIFIVDSKRAIARDDRTVDALDLGRVQMRLPRRDALEHLRQSVLGLPDWQALPDFAEQRAASWRKPGGPLAWQP